MRSTDLAGDLIAAAAAECGKADSPEAALNAIVRLAFGVLPFVPPQQVDRTLAWIRNQPCGREQDPDIDLYLRLIRAISQRDGNSMAQLSEAILARPAPRSEGAFWLAAGSGIVGYLALNRRDDARKLALRYRDPLSKLARREFAVRLALAHSGVSMAP